MALAHLKMLKSDERDVNGAKLMEYCKMPITKETLANSFRQLPPSTPEKEVFWQAYFANCPGLKDNCEQALALLKSQEPNELQVMLMNKVNDTALALRLLRKYCMEKQWKESVYLSFCLVMCNNQKLVSDRRQMVDLAAKFCEAVIAL